MIGTTESRTVWPRNAGRGDGSPGETHRSVRADCGSVCAGHSAWRAFSFDLRIESRDLTIGGAVDHRHDGVLAGGEGALSQAQRAGHQRFRRAPTWRPGRARRPARPGPPPATCTGRPCGAASGSSSPVRRPAVSNWNLALRGLTPRPVAGTGCPPPWPGGGPASRTWVASASGKAVGSRVMDRMLGGASLLRRRQEVLGAQRQSLAGVHDGDDAPHRGFQ